MAHINNPMVMMEQPSTATSTYAFDPSSSVIMQTLPTVHRSHYKLKKVVDDVTSDVAQMCESNRVALRSGLSYDQFLTGMLCKDEQILGSGGAIHYNSVIFKPVSDSNLVPIDKEPMTKGRLFLTNQRILLLSAEKYQGLNFASTGVDYTDKIKPGVYTVSGRCSDVLHYQCMPLGCVRSAELNVIFGVATSTNIFGRRFTGCCACCVCFGRSCDMCQKSWDSDSYQTTNLNQRVLTMGAVLPPWGHRYIVEIHIDANVPLSLVKDFIADLQRFAPSLLTVPGQ